MRSQFMQGFARVSFFGGFLLEKKTLIWGHFLFAPLLEPCENRCSAPPALRLSQMVQFRAQTPVLRLARNCRWSLLSSGNLHIADRTVHYLLWQSGAEPV